MPVVTEPATAGATPESVRPADRLPANAACPQACVHMRQVSDGWPLVRGSSRGDGCRQNVLAAAAAAAAAAAPLPLPLPLPQPLLLPQPLPQPLRLLLSLAMPSTPCLVSGGSQVKAKAHARDASSVHNPTAGVVTLKLLRAPTCVCASWP